MFIRITEAVELEQLSRVGNRLKIHPLFLSVARFRYFWFSSSVTGEDVVGLVVLKPSRRLLTKAKLGLAACAAG